MSDRAQFLVHGRGFLHGQDAPLTAGTAEYLFSRMSLAELRVVDREAQELGVQQALDLAILRAEDATR